MAPSYQNSPSRQLLSLFILSLPEPHSCTKRNYLLDINYSGVWWNWHHKGLQNLRFRFKSWHPRFHPPKRFFWNKKARRRASPLRLGFSGRGPPIRWRITIRLSIFKIQNAFRLHSKMCRWWFVYRLHGKYWRKIESPQYWAGTGNKNKIADWINFIFCHPRQIQILWIWKIFKIRLRPDIC